jgi:hypothetical protein
MATNQHLNLSSVRKGFFEKLDSLESAGFTYVRWSTANDDYVCLYCQDREKRLYSISEARKLLSSEFCQPSEPLQGCRCVIIPAKDPKEAIQNNKSRSPVKVIHNEHFEIRNGEKCLTITFDLKFKKGFKLKRAFRKIISFFS